MERHELIEKLSTDREFFMAKLNNAIDNKETINRRVMDLFERARVIKKEATALRDSTKPGLFRRLFSPNRLGQGIASLLYSLEDTMRAVDAIGNAADPLSFLMIKAAIMRNDDSDQQRLHASKIMDWADKEILNILDKTLVVPERMLDRYEERLQAMQKTRDYKEQ